MENLTNNNENAGRKGMDKKLPDHNVRAPVTKKKSIGSDVIPMLIMLIIGIVIGYLVRPGNDSSFGSAKTGGFGGSKTVSNDPDKPIGKRISREQLVKALNGIRICVRNLNEETDAFESKQKQVKVELTSMIHKNGLSIESGDYKSYASRIKAIGEEITKRNSEKEKYTKAENDLKDVLYRMDTEDMTSNLGSAASDTFEEARKLLRLKQMEDMLVNNHVIPDGRADGDFHVKKPEVRIRDAGKNPDVIQEEATDGTGSGYDDIDLPRPAM